ncbi:hypothetical protein B0H21DRAFT_726845 [Amylocystis lapponica]|nr:hypothetical protein B0H21DRAFT_726845 [Amylocystis lapponica]
MPSFFPLSAPAFALDLADVLTAEYLEEDEGQKKRNEEYWGLFVPNEPSAVPAPSPTPTLSEETLLALVALVLPLAAPHRDDTRANEVEPVASGSTNQLAILAPGPQIPPVDVAASGPLPTVPLPSAKAQGKKRARDDDDDGEQPTKRQATSSREEALATRAPATSAPAPTASLPSAKAQGKTRAHDDDGGEQPSKRQSTASREEAPATQAQAATSAPVPTASLPSAKAQGKKRAHDDAGGEQRAKRQATSSREEAPATQAAAPSTVLAATKPQRRGAHAGYEDPILVSAGTCACPMNGCEDSFAANKKAANAHLRQSHDLKGMAVDSQGRVSCPCKIEGDAVCSAKISRGDFGRHLVEQHVAKEDMMVWKCPREGCTYQKAARKESAERHVRTCFDNARKKAEGH